MEIHPPIFWLNAPRCPCCEGAGELNFYACDGCARIVLCCGELSTVFPDPMSPRAETAVWLDDWKCPTCGADHRMLRPARGDEIQALGFTTDQYS